MLQDPTLASLLNQQLSTMKYQAKTDKTGDVARLKDILANRFLGGEFLVQLSATAGLYDLDIYDTSNLGSYVNNCAHVVAELMFDQDGNIQPWTQDLLRKYGYEGEFNDACKQVVMSGALFQVAQSSVSKLFGPRLVADFKDGVPDDEKANYQQYLKETRRLCAVLTGRADGQTDTPENPNVTIHTILESLDQAKMASMTVNRLCHSMLSETPAATPEPKLPPVLNNTLLSPVVVNKLLEIIDIENHSEQEVAERIVGLTTEMLFDAQGEAKPWVKDLLEINGYSREMESDIFKEKLLNDMNYGLLQKAKGQDQIADPKRVLLKILSIESPEMGQSFQQTIENIRRNPYCREMKSVAPDPNQITDTKLRMLQGINREIEASAKQGFKFKMGISRHKIKIDGKSYKVPGRIAQIHGKIQAFLDDPKGDPGRVLEDVKTTLETKMGELDKSDKATQTLYRDIYQGVDDEQDTSPPTPTMR